MIVFYSMIWKKLDGFTIKKMITGGNWTNYQ